MIPREIINNIYIILMELNHYKHGSQFGGKNTFQSKQKSWLTIKIQRHTPTAQ